MEVRKIDNKNVWENFLFECKEKTFLQSWNWGEFQKTIGNKIWRLGFYNQRGEFFSVVLVIKIKAKRGNFLLIPHGPIFKFTLFENLAESKTSNLKFQILKTLAEELKKIAKEEKVDFIRIVPLLENSKENNKIFKDLGFKKAPMHANAYESTWKLDITLPEETLLKNMRKTTRYLIRQAKNDSNIRIFQTKNIKDVDIFYQIHKEVVKVQKFVPFSLEFLKGEFNAFLADDKVSLFLGEYKGKIIAGSFVVFWSNIGFYHHAALLPEYHKVPIAYLLQWEAIKEAKKRGCILYDFWGYVDSKKQPNHPWAGPSFFKTGFGGKAFEYVKTQDLPLSKKYSLIYLFEKLRKAKRGL